MTIQDALSAEETKDSKILTEFSKTCWMTKKYYVWNQNALTRIESPNTSTLQSITLINVYLFSDNVQMSVESYWPKPKWQHISMNAQCFWFSVVNANLFIFSTKNSAIDKFAQKATLSAQSASSSLKEKTCSFTVKLSVSSVNLWSNAKIQIIITTSALRKASNASSVWEFWKESINQVIIASKTSKLQCSSLKSKLKLPKNKTSFYKKKSRS